MEEGFPFNYHWSDFAWTLVGLVFFLLDVVLDVFTVVSFYQDGAYAYMGLMILLLLGSSVLLQVFSWLWYADYSVELKTTVEKCEKNHSFLKTLHVLQLGLFLRYAGVMEISTISLQNKERFPEGFAVFLTHDLSMLRLIETFSESAPQLVLMITIIARREELETVTYLKTAASAAAIAFSVVMYHRSMRSFLPDKAKQGLGSSVVYFMWNLLLIAPRLAAVALFASVLPCYVAAHFLSLWVWLVLWAWRQDTDFMNSTAGEWLYRATVGLIWYFSWFNLCKKRSRVTSIIYHSLMAVDIGLLLGMWWWRVEQRSGGPQLLSHLIVIITIVSCYLVGIILKLVYYKYVHPKETLKADIYESVDEYPESFQPASLGMDVVDFPGAFEATCTTPYIAPKPVTGANKRMRSLAANFYS